MNKDVLTKMRIDAGREYRNFLEFRALDPEDGAEEMRVEGYASTFEKPYTLWETDEYIVTEVMDKDAFNETDMSDVIMQYNHEGRVFARISNNTLEVAPDETGLKIRAELGGTDIGRQLYQEIKGGYTTKMSIGFTVEKDEVTERREDGQKTVIERRILSVKKLYDVSAVSIPANDTTEISARAFADGAISNAETERLKRESFEKKRERLALRCRLICGKEE